MRYAFEPGRIVFTESSGAPLTAGPSCQERQPGTVACGAQVGAAIKVETGDGADAVEPQAAGTPRVLMLIDGGGGRDELHGGGGADTLDDGDGSQGDPDTLDGGPGGRDEVSYAERSDDLDVDLARSAGPDGDVLTGLEGIEGGSGDDRLTASNRSSGVLRGGKGRDTLRGRARGDTLFGGEGRDVLVGGPGDDAFTIRLRIP